MIIVLLPYYVITYGRQGYPLTCFQFIGALHNRLWLPIDIFVFKGLLTNLIDYV